MTTYTQEEFDTAVQEAYKRGYDQGRDDGNDEGFERGCNVCEYKGY